MELFKKNTYKSLTLAEIQAQDYQPVGNTISQPSIVGGTLYGTSFKSVSNSATLDILPSFDSTIGIRILSSNQTNVLLATIDGTDTGDITIGNYAGGQGLKYDFSADTFSLTGAFSAGSISIGTSPNWFRVDTSGNIWSGADTLANAKASKFAVENTGALYATSATISGALTTSAGSTINGTYIDSLNVNKLAAGTITSKIITMAVAEGTGDTAIKIGKTDFGDTSEGIIFGIDDSVALNPFKWEMGDANYYINWVSGDLTIKPKHSNLQLYEAVVDAAGYGDYATVGAAIAANKTRIFIRNGSYTESGSITPLANTLITGESRTGVILAFGANTITLSNANVIFEHCTLSSTATISFITYSANCYFKDVYIDWNTSTENAHAIYCNTSSVIAYLYDTKVDIPNLNCFGIYNNAGKGYIVAENLELNGGGTSAKGFYNGASGDSTEVSSITHLILNGTFAATGAYSFQNAVINGITDYTSGGLCRLDFNGSIISNVGGSRPTDIYLSSANRVSNVEGYDITVYGINNNIDNLTATGDITFLDTSHDNIFTNFRADDVVLNAGTFNNCLTGFDADTLTDNSGLTTNYFIEKRGLSTTFGKTFKVTNTLTLSGTDSSTLNIGTGGTLASGAFAAAYSHPTGDGNLHVPANSTTNNGKVLTASGTAGLYTWETPIVYETAGAVSTHAALLTGIHGLAITAGKTLTVQDNVTITGALGTGAYATIANYALIASPVFTTKIQTPTIELGDASDTTFERVSAGVVSIEGKNIYVAGGTDVAVADGGTGKSSWTQYLIPYADTTTSFSQIAIGTDGQVLTSGGAGVAPSFETISSDIPYAADAGGSDAYAITLSPAWTSYTVGKTCLFKANTANTDEATLNVNSLGAITIKKKGATNLATNDILANQMVHVAYNELTGQLIDSETTNNDEFEIQGNAGGFSKYGNVFTNVEASTTLTSVVLSLKKEGSPTGTCVCKVYTKGAGNYPASPYASNILATSSTLDVSTLTTSFASKTFTFSGAEQISMAAATSYFLSIEYSGGDNTNSLHVELDTNGSGGGYYMVDTSTWYDDPNTKALIFSLYGTQKRFEMLSQIAN